MCLISFPFHSNSSPSSCITWLFPPSPSTTIDLHTIPASVPNHHRCEPPPCPTPLLPPSFSHSHFISSSSFFLIRKKNKRKPIAFESHRPTVTNPPPFESSSVADPHRHETLSPTDSRRRRNFSVHAIVAVYLASGFALVHFC